MKNTSNSYRPDIDGLRAVAILSVVFYHAGLGCPGGFVGVDVFFVISGFLIGGILLRELGEGEFSFSKFLERRIRRVAPAALVFLAVNLFFCWRVFPAPEYLSLAGQTLAALFGIANFKMLALTSGYWAPAANSVLLLHMWSLAVEEQFYVAIPIILLIAHRWFRRQILIVLLALLAGSLGLSLYWGADLNAANFYLLPSRAWELLAGCIGAWALQEGLAFPPKLASRAGVLGVILVGSSAFIFRMDAHWPAARTLLPVVGTFLVLVSPGSSPANRFLSSPPFRFVGLISYSLYLWHWPMAVFLRELGPDPITLADRWLLVGFASSIGALSWRFIEQPFRNKIPAFRISSKPLLIGAGLTWLCLVVISAEIAKTPLDRIAATASMPAIFNSPGGESTEKYDAGPFIRSGGIQFNASNVTPEIVVLGSSHGVVLGPVMQALSDAYHVPCALFCRGQAISPLFFGETISNHVPRRLIEHREQDEAERKYIAQWKPKMVLLAARWNTEWDNRRSSPEGSPASFVAEASNTVVWLSHHTDRVIVVGQAPQLPWGDFESARDGIWKRYRRDGGVMPQLVELPDLTAKRNLVLKVFSNCGVTNLTILDLDPFLHNANGSICYYDTNGLFYADAHHLNSIGSLHLKPLFEPYFQSAVRESR